MEPDGIAGTADATRSEAAGLADLRLGRELWGLEQLEKDNVPSDTSGPTEAVSICHDVES